MITLVDFVLAVVLVSDRVGGLNRTRRDESGKFANRNGRLGSMADEKTYPMVEIVGVSDDSIQQAVKTALGRASETIRNIDWFEVTEMLGVVENG
jgi:flavin-binding protein dodecin